MPWHTKDQQVEQAPPYGIHKSRDPTLRRRQGVPGHTKDQQVEQAPPYGILRYINREAPPGEYLFPAPDVFYSFGLRNSPILIIDTIPDISGNGGPLPVHRAGHIPMFYRVVMDVIQMGIVIRLVADGMFPIAALPDIGFPPSGVGFIFTNPIGV